MTAFQVFFTYLVSWWIVFMAVLPFGVQRVEKPEAGHSHGAPAKPLLLKKIIATTLISGVIVWLIALLLQSGIVPLRHAIPTD